MDQVVEITPSLRVESGGRLVEEEELGAPDDPHRDVETAPLAPGKGADLLVGMLLDPTSFISSSTS